jgi:guanosine-3',5'-bis(diphosphate) 3'-pyrophosphohydrolase
MKNTELQFFLGALKFASEKHILLKRKDVERTPYIHHPIRVAELICRVGGVYDPVILSAALLHDVIEDTDATEEEIIEKFGTEVAGLVKEVSDDKSLDKLKRKELQILHAATLSWGARIIKLADKISNVKDIGSHPPSDWDLDRKIKYLDWAERVVVILRGTNQSLEDLFVQTLLDAREKIAN